MDFRVQQAIIFMEENLDRKMSEKQFARQAGLTTQHFSLLLRANTGEPPMRYLNRLRMEKARELLESAGRSHLSIKEIAVCIGCRDVSHFVRDFEKRFGLSPKRFRATRHLNKPVRLGGMPSLSTFRIGAKYSNINHELI